MPHTSISPQFSVSVGWLTWDLRPVQEQEPQKECCSNHCASADSGWNRALPPVFFQSLPPAGCCCWWWCAGYAPLQLLSLPHWQSIQPCSAQSLSEHAPASSRNEARIPQSDKSETTVSCERGVVTYFTCDIETMINALKTLFGHSLKGQSSVL